MRNLIARLIVWAHRRVALRNARLRDLRASARGKAQAELRLLYADASFLDRLGAGEANAVHKINKIFSTMEGKPFSE